MQDKAEFVAGLSGVNLRREVKCGCVVRTPGKLEEVWKKEAKKQVKKLFYQSVEHEFGKS